MIPNWRAFPQQRHPSARSIQQQQQGGLLLASRQLAPLPGVPARGLPSSMCSVLRAMDLATSGFGQLQLGPSEPAHGRWGLLERALACMCPAPHKGLLLLHPANPCPLLPFPPAALGG